MGLTVVGKKYLMLVVGGYDKNIHVYTCLRQAQPKDLSKYFQYKFSLTGHIDSLKSFQFTNPRFKLENDT